MKVNFILPSTGESGGLKVIYRYALEFQKRGIEVRLYYPIIPYILKKSKNPVEFVYTFFRNLLSHIYHAVNKNKNPELRKILKPVLKINNFWIPDADIIIATAWPTAYDVDKLAESKGKKYYFVQGYEIWDNKELGEKSYFLPLKKIAISKWIVEQIHSQGVEEKIDIVHDGIDCESFYCNEDIEKKELKCLMLYNKLPIKGVKQGIKAFEIVKKKYHTKALQIILVVCTPITIGLFFEAKSIVLVVFGADFVPSIITLQVFAPFILLTTIGNLYGTQLLMMLNREKELLITVSVGAGINLVLNLILVNTFQQNGVAFASVVTEAIVMVAQIIAVQRQKLWLRLSKRFVVSTVIMNIGLTLFCILINRMIASYIIEILIAIIGGGGIYLFVGSITHNEAIFFILERIRGTLVSTTTKIRKNGY